MAVVLKEESTLQKQKSLLTTENFVLRYVLYGELVLSSLLSLFGLYWYFFHDSYSILITGLVFVFFAVSHYVKRGENKDNIGKIQSGRSGEEFVTNLLEEEFSDDYYLINDLDVEAGGREAQNDHILISRGGIFLIETKAYGGYLQGDRESENWTQKKDQSTKQVTNPIKQSEYHLEVFEDFLNTYNLPFDEDDLHIFVAMVDKNCDWSISGNSGCVDYAWTLPEKIEPIGNDSKYNSNQIENLIESLGLEIPENSKKNTANTSTQNLPNNNDSDNNGKSSSGSEKKWWIYRNESVSDRTYYTSELKQMDISPDTKICEQGKEEWQSANSVGELSDYFDDKITEEKDTTNSQKQKTGTQENLETEDNRHGINKKFNSGINTDILQKFNIFPSEITRKNEYFAELKINDKLTIKSLGLPNKYSYVSWPKSTTDSNQDRETIWFEDFELKKTLGKCVEEEITFPDTSNSLDIEINEYEKVNNESIAGQFTLILNGALSIRGVKLMKTDGNYWIGWPSEKGNDGNWYDLFNSDEKLEHNIITVAQEKNAKH